MKPEPHTISKYGKEFKMEAFLLALRGSRTKQSVAARRNVKVALPSG